MLSNHKPLLKLAILASLAAPLAANATNGMNLEGYGPVAAGMGGASMAYDNGAAAVTNNPATLALANDGHRADLALGFLGPDVNSSAMGTDWASDGDAYYMPAFGWINKQGDTSWGVAMFAQGGMGTEYNTGPGGAFSAMLMGSGGTATGAGVPNAGSITTAAGLEERSEVGVGRLMFPLAYNVNERLSIGGTIDFVWANLDLKMAMPGANMMTMIGGGLINGSMVTGLQSAMTTSQINDIYYGYFDFSDSNDFTGQSTGTGFAAKLGLTYQVNDQLSVGATYHSKTDIKDLDGSATVSMAVSADTGYLGGGANSSIYTDAVFPLSGTISIRDFQWPETYAAGLAYQANDRLLIAADIKQIQWADVMESFRMSFTADNSVGNGAFGGLTMNATMPQSWDDQTVIQLGASYLLDDQWTLRGGINSSSNPVPDTTVHYLFPAIVEDHYTVGTGYTLDATRDINFSFSYAPEVKVTSADGIDITHSQTSWQLMYSHRY